MSTLAERIELVIGWRGFSARKWADLAKLSPNALNTFLKRARLKPDAHLNGRTIIKLARAANVDSDWLSSGQGEPEPHVVAPEEVKELVASIGKASGVTDDVLEAFRAMRKPGASGLFWMAQLLAMSQDTKATKAPPSAKAR